MPEAWSCCGVAVRAVSGGRGAGAKAADAARAHAEDGRQVGVS